MSTLISSNNIQDYAITTAKLASSTITYFNDSVSPKINVISISNSTYSILDDTAVSTNGGYIVITGTGFQSGAQVLIEQTPATSVTYINSNELNVEVPAKSAATYNLYVANPDGGTGLKVNGLTYSAQPSWVTNSTLTSVEDEEFFNGNLESTYATSYELKVGSSLPSGVVLLSNGHYYGTANVTSNTTYNFTVIAEDDENQDSERTFSLPVIASAKANMSMSSINTSNVSFGFSNHALDLTGQLIESYEKNRPMIGMFIAGFQGLSSSTTPNMTVYWGRTAGGATSYSTGIADLGPIKHVSGTNQTQMVGIYTITPDFTTYDEIKNQGRRFIFRVFTPYSWTYCSLMGGSILGNRWATAQSSNSTGINSALTYGPENSSELNGSIILMLAGGKYPSGNWRTAGSVIGPFSNATFNISASSTTTDYTFTGPFGTNGLIEIQDSTLVSSSCTGGISSIVWAAYGPR